MLDKAGNSQTVTTAVCSFAALCINALVRMLKVQGRNRQLTFALTSCEAWKLAVMCIRAMVRDSLFITTFVAPTTEAFVYYRVCWRGGQQGRCFGVNYLLSKRLPFAFPRPPPAPGMV